MVSETALESSREPGLDMICSGRWLRSGLFFPEKDGKGLVCWNLRKRCISYRV